MNKSMIQVQSEMILSDLRDDFLNFLEENEIDFVGYNALDQGHLEAYLEEPYNSIYNSVDLMILELGFNNFNEWAFNYYELKNPQEWIENWSKQMLKDVYEYLKGQNENNG